MERGVNGSPSSGVAAARASTSLCLVCGGNDATKTGRTCPPSSMRGMSAAVKSWGCQMRTWRRGTRLVDERCRNDEDHSTQLQRHAHARTELAGILQRCSQRGVDSSEARGGGGPGGGTNLQVVRLEQAAVALRGVIGCRYSTWRPRRAPPAQARRRA